MICKARSCAKLVGMIDADHVPVRHVSGSHHLGRIMHEMITTSSSGRRRWRHARWHVGVMLYVECRKLSLFEWLDLSELRPRCTGERSYKRVRHAVKARVWGLVIRKGTAP